MFACCQADQGGGAQASIRTQPLFESYESHEFREEDEFEFETLTGMLSARGLPSPRKQPIPQQKYALPPSMSGSRANSETSSNMGDNLASLEPARAIPRQRFQQVEPDFGQARAAPPVSGGAATLSGPMMSGPRMSSNSGPKRFTAHNATPLGQVDFKPGDQVTLDGRPATVSRVSYDGGRYTRRVVVQVEGLGEREVMSSELHTVARRNSVSSYTSWSSGGSKLTSDSKEDQMRQMLTSFTSAMLSGIKVNLIDAETQLTQQANLKLERSLDCFTLQPPFGEPRAIVIKDIETVVRDDNLAHSAPKLASISDRCFGLEFNTGEGCLVFYFTDGIQRDEFFQCIRLTRKVASSMVKKGSARAPASPRG